MTLYPMKMEPFYQERPWGGRRMKDLLGKNIPAGPIGESWEVSPHPGGLSRVANGPLKGRSLPELARLCGRELLGGSVQERYGGAFPLLIKLIDIHALASLQVHPNDQQAMALENYPMGKEEAWYIIERAPEAEFYAGLRRGVTRQGLLDALADGTIKELLERVDVQPGQCLHVPPGTVHACGNGVFMLEVQQCSDLTYRLHDWDRTNASGSGRELHIEKALEVIDFEARPTVFQAEPVPNRLNQMLRCPSFRIYESAITDRLAFPATDAFLAGTLISGRALLAGEKVSVELRTGDSFIIPANMRVDALAERCRIILATVE